jgi:hypothetical protein
VSLIGKWPHRRQMLHVLSDMLPMLRCATVSMQFNPSALKLQPEMSVRDRKSQIMTLSALQVSRPLSQSIDERIQRPEVVPR